MNDGHGLPQFFVMFSFSNKCKTMFLGVSCLL